MAILTGLWHRFSNSLPWVCLGLFPVRGVARPGHELGSMCQGLVVHLLLSGLTWREEMRFIQVARSLLVAGSPQVLLILGGKGSMWVGTPDMSQSSASSSSSYAVFQVGMLFKYFDQWRIIISNKFVLNMVLGPHLQVRPCPPLFHNFRQFNVKVVAAHHPIIQKEVDELLAKGAIEPSSGGAGCILVCLWFLSILVASGPYLTSRILIIICIYLLLRCQLSDMFGSLFSMVIMLLPLIYRMLIYIFHHHFLCFIATNDIIQLPETY